MSRASHGTAGTPSAGPATPGRGRAPLPRTVRGLAAVSLLTDAASEMIYPLLPLFLGTTLGAGALGVGVVEGAAESTAALVKWWSGRWSDRMARRKPLVLAGYALASAVRPLVAVATSAGQVLAIRLADRVGKGVRGAPRDALIADAVSPDQRGRAFGVHRAADHLGAVIGPLLAWVMLGPLALPLRTVFLWAAVPGALAVLVLWRGVREAPRSLPAPAAAAPAAAVASDVSRDAPRPDGLPPRFFAYLGVLLLFTLGNSTDAFLLLRASQVGVPDAQVPLLWGALHVVKSASSVWGGSWSDRLGRRPLIISGWLVYAAVYAGFAVVSAPWQLWALFLSYGVHHGLTEGVEKALVADLVPAARRGTAFGWYNLTLGVGALPAAMLFGAVWQWRGGGTAFMVGAGSALVAAVLLPLVVPRTTTTE